MSWSIVSHISKCALLTTTFAFVTGCTSSEAYRKEVESLRRSMEDLRSVQADQSTRIDALENRVRSLSGHLEEVKYSQDYQLEGDVSSLKKDISSLRRRVPPPPIVPVMALEADEVLAPQLPAEHARLFSNALVRVREGNFREALPILSQIEDRARGQEWLPYVLFWKGVCYDAIGDNKGALASYNAILAGYPKSGRTPLALLRQASVFVRLRDTSSARLVLQKLIAEFPGTTEARQAKERLGKL